MAFSKRKEAGTIPPANAVVPSSITSTAVSTSTAAVDPLSNVDVEGTDLTLEGLPPEQRIFVQGMISKKKVWDVLQYGESTAKYGVRNYKLSPLYQEYQQHKETLKNKLDIILKTIAGQMPSDFRRYENGKYIDVGLNEITQFITKDEKGRLIFANSELTLPRDPYCKFPQYNALLSRYVAGRYEHGTAKPSYTDSGLKLLVNYFEKEPVAEYNAKLYIANPIMSLKDNETTKRIASTKFKGLKEEEAIQKAAIELYQGTMKFDFNYTMSEKVWNIFESLKNVYRWLLNWEEAGRGDDYAELPEKMIPWKLVYGKKLYIEDDTLRNKNLPKLAADLRTPEVLNLIVDANCKSYELHYIKIDDLRNVLNSILGDENWTVELSSEITWYGNKVIRGYYVDKLGNFKYGQLVRPVEMSNFGNSDADKERSNQSLLERALITEVFKTLSGIDDKQKKKLDALKKQVVEASMGDSLREYYILQNNVDESVIKQLDAKFIGQNDEIKLIEEKESKPLKRIAEAREEPAAKRTPGWEEKEKGITPEEKDFKEINKNKGGMIIEEQD